MILVGRLFLVELFLRYDTFTAEVGKDPLGAKVVFTGITKSYFRSYLALSKPAQHRASLY